MNQCLEQVTAQEPAHGRYMHTVTRFKRVLPIFGPHGCNDQGRARLPHLLEQVRVG